MTDLVVHDGIDEDGDAVLGENLLRRHIVGLCPHVYLYVDIHAGNDEEDTGTSRTAGEKTTKTEDYGALIFLHHFDRETEGEGEGDEYEDDGGDY